MDLPDFRYLDAATSPDVDTAPDKKLAVLPGKGRLDGDAMASALKDRDGSGALPRPLWSREAVPLLRRLQEIDVTELAQVIVMWIQQFNPSVSRRELLSKLSVAFAIAAVTPLFDVLNLTDEDENLTRVAEHPGA